jgi:hypothetical protein
VAIAPDPGIDGPVLDSAQAGTEDRVYPISLLGVATKVVPVGTLAAAHALAETGIGGEGTALSLDLTDGDAHATRSIHDDVQARAGQQISTCDLVLLKGDAAGLCPPVAELDDEAGLVGFISRCPTRHDNRRQEPE